MLSAKCLMILMHWALRDLVVHSTSKVNIRASAIHAL